MNLTCPCCHARYSIDAMLQDESARDLLAMRGTLPPRIWNPLLAYLGLFRSETRALAWDRALKLAKEVQELGSVTGEWDKLENALAETVEALRQRGGKPMKNHNYLKRVLESQVAQGSGLRAQGQDFPPSPQPRTPRGSSKAATAIQLLEEWVGGDWLRQQIAMGHSALVAQNLKHAPAAEIITKNADIWHVTLKSLLIIPEVDADRYWIAFTIMVKGLTEWPQPKQLIELLPPRPERKKLTQKASDAEYEAGAEKLRQLRETL